MRAHLTVAEDLYGDDYERSVDELARHALDQLGARTGLDDLVDRVLVRPRVRAPGVTGRQKAWSAIVLVPALLSSALFVYGFVAWTGWTLAARLEHDQASQRASCPDSAVHRAAELRRRSSTRHVSGRTTCS